MKIKLIKFQNFEKAPTRAHWNDSGADVYATKDIVLKPGINVVDLGFGLELPDGYDAVVYCKSGLSSKGIFASNSPIDSGYRGECHAILGSFRQDDLVIKKGEKVGQLVIRPVIYADFVETIDEEARGTGAFGSTDKK